jgi:hypothetical protein
MKKVGSLLSVLFIPCALAICIGVMEHDVLSRTPVAIGEDNVLVAVMQDHSLSFAGNGNFSTSLFMKNGKVVARHGIMGGKGRWPITYLCEPTRGEITLYKKFFPS